MSDRDKFHRLLGRAIEPPATSGKKTPEHPFKYLDEISTPGGGGGC